MDRQWRRIYILSFIAQYSSLHLSCSESVMHVYSNLLLCLIFLCQFSSIHLKFVLNSFKNVKSQAIWKGSTIQKRTGTIRMTVIGSPCEEFKGDDFLKVLQFSKVHPSINPDGYIKINLGKSGQLADNLNWISKTLNEHYIYCLFFVVLGNYKFIMK